MARRRKQTRKENRKQQDLELYMKLVPLAPK